MSLPIVEQIAEEIKATVETVTIANGYELDIGDVVRPTRTGITATPDNYGVILLQLDPARGDLDNPGNPPALSWRQPFALDLCVRPSDTVTTPIDRLINIFSAEVVKAIMADVTRGGLAIDTHLDELQFMRASDGTYEGVTMFIEVIYRVAENDPSAQM